jgi:hypothetical protein
MAAQYQRGLSELSTINRFAIGRSLFLLAVLCCTLIACGGPDYTKPGVKGEKLPEDAFLSLFLKHYSVTVQTPLPSPLACNKVYTVAVRVFDPGVKCEGYNFQKLFGPAQTMAANRIKALSLSRPPDCSPLQQRKSKMRWNCQPVGATLDLQVSLVCPKSGTPLPPDQNPTAQELTTNDFSFPPGADPTLGANEELSQILTLPSACPGKKLLTVYYEEKVPNLANLINPADCTSRTNASFYKPYADKGEALAKEYYDSFTCPTSCTKAPFQVFRQEWQCDKSSVIVKTYFYIDCQK